MKIWRLYGYTFQNTKGSIIILLKGSYYSLVVILRAILLINRLPLQLASWLQPIINVRNLVAIAM